MTEERIIAYLLDELPEDDLERFEDESFAQESWPAEIHLVEEDLIDAYLRNELIPERKQRFEQNYLTTEARHERVCIAASLLRHIDQSIASKGAIAVPPKKLRWADRLRAFWSSQNWGLRVAAAIAIVTVVAGSMWLFFRAPSPRPMAAVTLSISSSNRAEGAQAKKVKLAPNAQAVNITLTLPQQARGMSYRVELENESGETKSAEVAGNDAQSVLVVIPAPQLARGQYALKLFVTKTDGTEQRTNGAYFFVVE